MNGFTTKYAILTTVESTMRSFGVPLVKEFTNKGIETSLLCKMSEEFIQEYSKDCMCIPVEIERGFHPINLIKTIFQLIKIFRKEKYDIVQYGTENMAFCASIAAWVTRIPIRIYEHWGARYVGYNGIMRIVSKIIEHLSATFSTTVRQVSNGNMEMCIADGIYKRDKVKVLGKGGTVGVDFSQFDLKKKEDYNHQIRQQFNIPENAVIFGFVGRIQSDKGVNELIDAFQRIHSETSDVFLLLVGAIDDANPIDESKMQWAQDCPNIVFSGYVLDVYRYMSAFDIMVHPTYREGFGMVLQEAAALKVPIITTNIMGPGEYICNGETGILVEVRDCQMLSEAMHDLYEDKVKRDFLAENNYKYTMKYFERSVMVERIIKDRLELLSEKKMLEKCNDEA